MVPICMSAWNISCKRQGLEILRDKSIGCIRCLAISHIYKSLLTFRFEQSYGLCTVRPHIRQNTSMKLSVFLPFSKCIKEVCVQMVTKPGPVTDLDVFDFLFNASDEIYRAFTNEKYAHHLVGMLFGNLKPKGYWRFLIHPWLTVCRRYIWCDNLTWWFKKREILYHEVFGVPSEVSESDFLATGNEAAHTWPATLNGICEKHKSDREHLEQQMERARIQSWLLQKEPVLRLLLKQSKKRGNGNWGHSGTWSYQVERIKSIVWHLGRGSSCPQTRDGNEESCYLRKEFSIERGDAWYA